MVFVAACLAAASPNEAQAQVSVLTYHNDNYRTGQNQNEYRLTPGNLNSTTFGKVAAFHIDGEAFGQPLYAPQVRFADQSVRNLVFVVTEHDSVYAFDADNTTDGQPLWQVSFINPAAGITTMLVTDLGLSDPATPEIGITSTPVIDPTTQTLYVVAKTKEVIAGSAQYYFRLHALDIRTGAEKFGGPVVITGSVPGSGTPNDGANNVLFQALKEHQRSALLLLNGVVYIAWASIGDLFPYHGWIIGYDAQSLQQVTIFNDTPNGSDGGIWSGGAGPAADGAGNFYVSTGNGTFDYDQGPDYGDSVLKLSLNNSSLTVTDSFTPSNQDYLDVNDLDLGSGGVLVIPDQPDTPLHLLVQAGKEGTIYLMNRDNMGGFQADGDSQLVQSLPSAIAGSFGMAAYFNQRIYYCGMMDYLRAFDLRGGQLSTQPTSLSVHQFGYGGSTPSISANGATNGILWALDNGGFATFSPTVLHAFDANDLGTELYNSSQAGARDAAGFAVRFTVPTVANGKVFVGTGTELSIYGPLKSAATPILASSAGNVFTNQTTVSLNDATAGAIIRYTLDGSMPDASSPRYTQPLILTNTTQVKARAFASGVIDSEAASETFYSAGAIGHGSGLLAQYYSSDAGFENPPTLVRIDPSVDFSWLGAAPATGVPGVPFGARWSGQLTPQFSETYTFYTLASGVVHLTLDDQPIIDQSVDQPYTEASGSVALTAGQSYDLVLEYDSGAETTAVAQLLWSSPSTAKSIIPTSQLSPATNTSPWVALQAASTVTALTAPGKVTLAATVSDSADFSEVAFFSGTTPVGTVTNAPFTLSLTNLAAGAYSVSAQATDVYGTVFQSSPVNFTVNPPTVIAPRLLPAGLAWSNGEFQLVLAGQPGASYLIQTSSDLVHWTDVTTVVSSGASTEVIDSQAAGRAQFYRAFLR